MNDHDEAGDGSNGYARRQHTHDTRHDIRDEQRTDGNRRPTTSRVTTGSSDRSDVRYSRFQSPDMPHAYSHAHDTSRIQSRDFPDHTSPSHPSLGRLRGSEVSLESPGIRRRVGSAQPSPSPGPSHHWRILQSPRRTSVAIAAASGHDADTATRKFSLAGPAPVETLGASQPYVDPGYTQLNPAYDQPSNVRPVWGLAKPLPRVLRPGMVPATDELESELSQQREEQNQTPRPVDVESGRIDPTLRPDRISSHLDKIRREREIQLFENYQHQKFMSPALSPFGKARSPFGAIGDVPDLQLPPRETIVEEDEEQQRGYPGQEQPTVQHPQHPRGAAADADPGTKEDELKLPYEDAVPLLTYEAENDEIHNLHTYWSVIRLRFREPFAELLAIMVQFTLGFSANLSLTVSRGASGVGDTADWAWGLATMIAIYIAGGISGAHLNPAISIMLYIYRGFPLRKVPIYIAAQVLGAFLAALIAFGIFRPGLMALQEGEVMQTQNEYMSPPSPLNALPHPPAVLANFITFPRNAWVDSTTAFLTEFTGTAILTVSVLALGDDTNAPPGAGMNAFIIGLVVALLGMALGYNTGLAMNPARDFGPRLALAALGYGRGGLSPSLFADGYWFRVAWLGPLAGTVTGGFLYDAMIFVGGESPVNYPTTRIKRAAWKWKNRWMARFGVKP